MKIISLILATFLMTLKISHGQTNVYHPFPDANAVWIWTDCNSFPPTSGCYTIWYCLKGDTVINSTTYHKLCICDSNQTALSTIGGIRQDIPNKKIYFICVNGNPNQVSCSNNFSERLLYNFNAAIGDTILYPVGPYNCPSCIEKVQTIDSVQLNDGTFRKRFNKPSGGASPPWSAIIEGMGSESHLLNGMTHNGPYVVAVECFKQNNITLFNGQAPYNACSKPTAVKEINSSFLISASPNPFSMQTTLKTDGFFKNATLTVYNIYGELVKQIDNLSEHAIIFRRDDLPGGLYFIRLIQDGNLIATDKLIITDN